MSEQAFEQTYDFPEVSRLELEHGIVAKVKYEEYIEDFHNPREMDQLAHMAVSYRDYTLGDEELPSEGFGQIDCPVCEGGERQLEGPENFVRGNLGTYTQEVICPRCENCHQVEPTVEEWLRDRKAEVAAPLFVYEHSGITIKSGVWRTLEQERIAREDTRSSGRFMGDDAGWDTSFVGFIYVTRERACELGIPGTVETGERDEHGSLVYEVGDVDKMREAMIEQAEGEVKEYASYLEGEVYYFVVENADGETLESCGGFVGDSEYAEQEARPAAEHAVDEAQKEIERVAEWNARDVMTID